MIEQLQKFNYVELFEKHFVSDFTIFYQFFFLNVGISKLKT